MPQTPKPDTFPKPKTTSTADDRQSTQERRLDILADAVFGSGVRVPDWDDAPADDGTEE